jgi:hypothetical protein
MRSWKLSVVTAFFGVVSILLASPASADSPRSYHGNDWGQIITVSPGDYNDYIVACDGEADGRYVWSQYHLVNGAGYSAYWNVYDFDGPNNGCAHADWRGTPYWARAVRICEYEGGCGPWKYIY